MRRYSGAGDIGGGNMTITTEEAELLARLSNFADHLQTLQYKEMRQLITELAAERDALRAESARLREALRKIKNKARTGRPPFMSLKTDYFQIASAALGETQ